MPLAKQLRFKSFLPSVKLVGVAIAASTLLVGCGGGGGGSSEQSTPTTRIIAFGDSTTDSGTYGGKYIVNNTIPLGEGSNSIWIDSIAQAIGIDEVCPYYDYLDSGTNEFLASNYSSNAACTNFAVGGGRINAAAASFNFNPGVSTPATAAGATAALSPRSAPMQMATASSLLAFSPADLALVSVSGNDLADFLGPILGLLAGDPTNVNALLLQSGFTQDQINILRDAELASFATGESNYANAGEAVAGAYLQLSAGYVGGLATGLHNSITESLLNSGVEKVVILNMPNALVTPLLIGVLDSLGLSAENRAVAEAIIQDFIGVYNVQLSALFAGDPRVIVFDLNALVTEISDADAAAALGFSNTVFPTCGDVSAHECSEVVASGTVQAVYGVSADWETFLWADTFHPSELAHDVISERVVSAMQARGWR